MPAFSANNSVPDPLLRIPSIGRSESLQITINGKGVYVVCVCSQNDSGPVTFVVSCSFAGGVRK